MGWTRDGHSAAAPARAGLAGAEPVGLGAGLEAWSPRYAPFADDSFGDGYFVDLRDGPAYGSVGKWAHDDNRIAAVWPSLTAALAGVADALERNARFDDWTPLITDSRELDWEP